MRLLLLQGRDSGRSCSFSSRDMDYNLNLDVCEECRDAVLRKDLVDTVYGRQFW